MESIYNNYWLLSSCVLSSETFRKEHNHGLHSCATDSKSEKKLEQIQDKFMFSGLFCHEIILPGNEVKKKLATGQKSSEKLRFNSCIPTTSTMCVIFSKNSHRPKTTLHQEKSLWCIAKLCRDRETKWKSCQKKKSWLLTRVNRRVTAGPELWGDWLLKNKYRNENSN